MKKFFVIAFIGFCGFIYITAFQIRVIFATSVINGVSAVNIMGSGAQITWTTDTASDSNVYYGTSSGIYPLTSSMRCDGGGMVTSHCVNLMYLSSGTAYYYKVSSTGESSTNSISEGHQFTSAGETTATAYYSSSSSSVYTTTAYSSSSRSIYPTTDSGSLSSIAYPTTNQTPVPPSNVYAVLIYSNNVNISWTDSSSNESYFEIYRRPSGGTWNRLTSASYPPYYDTGLAFGTYEYYVKACNSYGCSAPTYSATVTISSTTTVSGSSYSSYYYNTTTTQMPTAPSNIYTSLAYPNSVNISWKDNSSNETRFDIYRRTTSGTWILAASKSSGYASHYDTGLSAGTYEYFVTACNSYGCSMAVYSTGVIISSTTTTFSSSSSSSFTATTTATQMPTAVISGTVSDSFGRAVPGSFVYITPKTSLDNIATQQPYSTTTSNTGSFRIYLPAGKYAIETFPPSGQNYLKPSLIEVAISSGETRNIYIYYPAGTKILSGAVTFPDGKPVIDAEIGAYRKENGQWVKTFTDALGKFEMNLSGGSWEISIRPKDGQNEKWKAQSPYTAITFSNDGLTETKKVDFRVTNLESIIVFKVVDSVGNPVSGAGVVVDTISAANAISYSSDTERQMKYLKTGIDGISKFYIPSGTYFIRVYAPEGSSATAPSEEKIFLNSGETKNVEIALRQENALETLTVKGETKLDNGTLTDAFIWAWSEKGGNEKTNSSMYGNFSLTLAKGQKWHIGAGKDSSAGYYKSSELIIDTGESAHALSLILSKYGTETVQAPVTVEGKATEQIIAEGDDGVRFSLPAGSVSDSGPISVEVKPTVEAPSQAASTVVSKVYDITVTNSAGKNFSTLSSEAEVTIPYDETELKNKGVSIESVIPSFFDESTGIWVAVSNYTIDKVKKIVILRVNHLTRFALIAAADTIPPSAPTAVSAVIVKNSSEKFPNKVKVSWKNPLTGFDHSKVYRSEESGKIGKVIATVVITESFMDESEFASGKSYYYTVRAVDSAGNESNNANQVSIAATWNSSELSSLNKQTTFLLPPGQALSGEVLRNLNIGSSGDDVKTLQKILANEAVYPQAIISGYFGQMTKSAVIKFQEKYFSEILAPGGFARGTGYVGIATRRKLNEILRNQQSSSSSQGSDVSNAIVNSLTVGSRGEEVNALQNILIKEGVYTNGKVTGIFDSSTKEAVKLFQEKYASEILDPIGLSEGTGFFGAATRKKVNELISQ